MRIGDRVTLSHDGATVEAEILTCSGNQRSLFVEFDGSFAEHTHGMPILMDNKGKYRSLVTGVIVEVEAVS